MKTINMREVSLSEIVDLPAHPASECFPMLEKNASKREEGKTKTITLAELADSINEHGLQEPIVIFDTEFGKFLLDGRNRRAACVMAAKVRGVSADEFIVLVEDFEGTNEEAKGYVKTLNLDRRDLEPSQRAVSAIKWWDMEAEEAEKRNYVNRIANLKQNQNDSPGSPNLGGRVGATAELLAAEFRVAKGYIEDAQRIERERLQAAEAAERAAQLAETYELVEVEAKAELQQAVEVGDRDKMREASSKINNATTHKVDEREKAAEHAVKASQKADLIKSLHEGDKKLSEVRKERLNEGKDDREIAISKAASQFNDGYNKVMDNGAFLLTEGRPNDQENVRLKYSHICEKFDILEEVPLQTNHYFTPEREPTDDVSRWAGEVRIRLGGIDRIIQERDVIPSMVTKNVEFLDVIYRLREFLDEVEKSLDEST